MQNNSCETCCNFPTLFEPECSRLTHPGLLHRLFFRRRTLYPAELQKHVRKKWLKHWVFRLFGCDGRSHLSRDYLNKLTSCSSFSPPVYVIFEPRLSVRLQFPDPAAPCSGCKRFPREVLNHLFRRRTLYPAELQKHGLPSYHTRCGFRSLILFSLPCYTVVVFSDRSQARPVLPGLGADRRSRACHSVQKPCRGCGRTYRR